MKTITLDSIPYEIDRDGKDIQLLAHGQTLMIYGGIAELEQRAFDAHHYMDQLTGEVECSIDMEAWIEANIEDYILETYKSGTILKNEE